MSHDPEIVISTDKSVLKQASNSETLTACWDASQDSEFMALMHHIRTFNQSADFDLLKPIEGYAESQLPEICNIIEGAERAISGYLPLEIIAEEEGEHLKAETIPHVDHPSYGMFFYFNEHSLSTGVIPTKYAGQADSLQGFPDADKSTAIILPPQSIAIIKLGAQPHFAPEAIPPKTHRVIAHARYDLF